MTRVFVLVALAVACTHPAAGPPLAPLPASPDGIDRATEHERLDQLEDLADRTCACPDDACREQVDRDIAAEIEANRQRRRGGEPKRGAPDLAALREAAIRRVLACNADHDRIPAWEAIAALHQLEALQTTACACTDLACATAAARELATMDLAAVAPDEATLEPLVAAEDKVKACVTTVAGQQLVLDIKALRKQACACTDAACADATTEGVDRLRATYQDVTVDASSQQAAGEIVGEIDACLTAARGR